MTEMERVNTRLKCLEMFVTIASKAGIEQDIVFQKAEKAWEFATETITKGNTGEAVRPPNNS